jgi:hypothetical protein
MADDPRIIEQNPWWRSRDVITSDPHLVRARTSPFHWEPPVLAAIAPQPGNLDTLRGPRQVGKTTSAKRMLERLVARGERRVFYYSFDLERDNAAIPDVIRRAKALCGFESGSWYLFLDEVTTVPDWQRGIKYAWDAGLTREDYVLCTGSSARRMGTEQLPGRRGKGRDYVQLPMSFRDFCRSVRGIDLPEETASIGEVAGEAGRMLLRRLYLHTEALQAAFGAYRQVGGLPAAIADYVAGGGVSSETFAMIWATLSHEIQQARLDTTAALKLLERVGVSLGSSLSWQSAAESMGAGSHNTAHQYAVALAESFVLLLVFHWSVGGGFEPRKQRKLYFLDPLVGYLPATLAPGMRTPSADGVTEGLVATALFRAASEYVTQAEPALGALGYWRSSKGREIDFVVPDDTGDARGRRIAIEVKGDAPAAIRNAVLSIRRSFGRGIVATRTVFEPESNVPLIPVPVLLAALRERTERTMSPL